MRVPFAILSAAQVGDVATTWHGIQSGLVREANPLGVLGLHAGLPGLVALKLIALASAAGGVHVLVRAGHPRIAANTLRANAVLYVGIVAWNLYTLHG